MASSDLLDFSDSNEDESPQVPLDCGSCKKKFKSTDRGCDTDERTCSTCTRSANKALMKIFMVEPRQSQPLETTGLSAGTSDLTVEDSVNYVEGGNQKIGRAHV